MTSYIQNVSCFEAYQLTLKQRACPRCHSVGFLIRHGFLRGYGLGSDVVQRGWRIFCSNRQRRQGCGLTHAVLLSHILFRRSVTTVTWELFWRNLLAGLPFKDAWPVCAHGMECGRRLWRAWSQSHLRIRALLCSLGPPAAEQVANPLLQTMAHLLDRFPSLAAVQVHFQISLL